MVKNKVHICSACAFEYMGISDERPDFDMLPEDWQCPECGSPKFVFHDYDWQYSAPDSSDAESSVGLFRFLLANRQGTVHSAEL